MTGTPVTPAMRQLLEACADWPDVEQLARQRAKNFERKVDADRFASTVTADVLRGHYIDRRLGRTFFKEFSERWTATRGTLSNQLEITTGTISTRSFCRLSACEP